MRHSRYSNHTSSVSSVASSQQSATNKLKSPVPSDYEYVGRLVTRERPTVQKSKSGQQNTVFSQTKQHQHHVRNTNCPPIYEDVSCSSSGDDTDDIDGLSKPLGVIRINDRHLREIYRLPTPPPKVKRVYHRLRSPETKVIERVFVRRPPPQIIENIIEVPPEKVRIINREKILGKSKPITRSKLIRLKARHNEQETDQQTIEEEQEVNEQQQETQPIFAPAQVYPQTQPQQATYNPAQTYYPQQQQQQQETQPIFTPAQAYPQTQSQQATYNPAGTYYPQQQQQQPTQTTTVSFNPPHQPVTTTATAMVYPPQPNMRTVGYIQSSIPPHVMFNSQKALQIPTPQASQATPYTFIPQQTVNHQTVKASTPFTYIPQQTTPMMSFGNTRY